MRNLLVLGMVGVAAFMAGWFTISRDEEGTTIRFNRDEIRQDTSRVIQKGREFLEDRTQVAGDGQAVPGSNFPGDNFAGPQQNQFAPQNQFSQQGQFAGGQFGNEQFANNQFAAPGQQGFAPPQQQSFQQQNFQQPGFQQGNPGQGFAPPNFAGGQQFGPAGQNSQNAQGQGFNSAPTYQTQVIPPQSGGAGFNQNFARPASSSQFNAQRFAPEQPGGFAPPQ